MSIKTKILLTIASVVLCSWLFGCGAQKVSTRQPELSDGSDTNLTFLSVAHSAYNEEYFGGKLRAHIGLDETQYMASTICEDDGSDCRINFNLRYTVAPRVALITMLHEMCHEKTWMQDKDMLGKQIGHGYHWRSCMVLLDAEGAFRKIIIDNYSEQVR
ncbi:SprT-like family protein [uncultured archaeon]|nr:SprT-like family protein [uncultured archaeon]